MLLLLIPQGPAGTGPPPTVSGLDVAASLADVIYRLGFQGLNDFGAEPWVSTDELYQFADEAAKKIAYQSGVFLTLDASITVTPGTAVYELPATHVYTLAAALGNAPLRITPVRDLWALDANWAATSGPSTRCSFDAGSVGTISLYPSPTAGGSLNQVCQEFPPQVQAGASAIALPTVLQDFLSYAMLAGARGKESEAAMPEMAAHFAERCALYEQIIEHLWGAGQ